MRLDCGEGFIVFDGFGQIIWFAGGEIERFGSIKAFLEGMMEYSKADMRDLET